MFFRIDLRNIKILQIFSCKNRLLQKVDLLTAIFVSPFAFRAHGDIASTLSSCTHSAILWWISAACPIAAPTPETPPAVLLQVDQSERLVLLRRRCPAPAVFWCCHARFPRQRTAPAGSSQTQMCRANLYNVFNKIPYQRTERNKPVACKTWTEVYVRKVAPLGDPVEAFAPVAGS